MWTEKEICILKEFYGILSVRDLAKKLGKTESAVYSQIYSKIKGRRKVNYKERLKDLEPAVGIKYLAKVLKISIKEATFKYKIWRCEYLKDKKEM